MHAAAPEHDELRAEAVPAVRARHAALAATVALGVVLLTHGFLPGLLNTTAWVYLLEGDMRCLQQMGPEALTSWCDSYGGALGYPFYSSGPIAYLGWSVMAITGMSSSSAYLISGMAFDALALAGGYRLLRMLGARPVTSLIGSVAYLISPTIVGLRDYGGTFTGIALLPAFAVVDLLAMRALERGGRKLLAAVAVAYTAVKTFALFMDGYAFILSALLSAALWLWWLARGRASRRARAVGIAGMFGAHVVAAAVYYLYVPGLGGGVESLDLFRAMGVDISTLILPSEYVWFADLLGVARDHSDLWGDGSNAFYNYVGLVCTILAGVAVATRRRQPYVIALAAVGVVALALSLGPSLKVNDVRGVLPARPGAEAYLMPADKAAVELPWKRLFRVPGVSHMRATYRWSAVTRLVLIVLAVLAIERMLLQPRRRAVGVAVAAVAMAGIAPNVPLLVSEYRDHHRSREAFDSAVIGDLSAATRRDESAFFLSPDGTYIDYLVNYLAPTAGIKALNAGGDKNAGAAQTTWPPSVVDLTRGTPRPEQVVRALESGNVDVIVAPYFHLRWGVYDWPPSASSRLAARRRFAVLLESRGVTVDRYRWFATMRLAR